VVKAKIIRALVRLFKRSRCLSLITKGKAQGNEVNIMETWHWILIVVIAALVVAIIPYLILKYGCRKPMPSVMSYLFMIFMFWTWIFTIYETPNKRREKLKKAGVKQGQVIVDLGCGLGRFTSLAAKIVGPEGKVCALDIHPLHTAIVMAIKRIGGYKNIDVVQANCCATGLPDKAIDLIFINDAFHEFDKVGCLKEAVRILKSDGILAIDEHEIKESKFLSIIDKANLFTLFEKEKRLYKFRPRT
jgi:SAM-dependent methyltransferase